MMTSKDTASIVPYLMKVIELMQLGKVEKGSLTPDGKFGSLQARWFSSKPKNVGPSKPSTKEQSDGVYIRRDTLVTLNCQRGGTISVEYYRVLALFSKHYNKWFVHWDSNCILFQRGSKKYKFLFRKVERDGGEWKEVELEKHGSWSPKFVFCTRSMCDIVNVEDQLNGSDLNW